MLSKSNYRANCIANNIDANDHQGTHTIDSNISPFLGTDSKTIYQISNAKALYAPSN